MLKSSTFLLFLVLAAPQNFLNQIDTEAQFESISKLTQAQANIVSATKFITPVKNLPQAIPTSFQDVNTYSFHLDFLLNEFSDRFAGLSLEEYRRLVEVRESREYFAGTLFKFKLSDDSIAYGFDFYTDPSSSTELPTQEEVEWVYDSLRARFKVEDIFYAPLQTDVQEHISQWQNTKFKISQLTDSTNSNFQAYTTGLAYGWLKRYSLEEILESDSEGSIGLREIIFVDQAPGDLTSPVSAMITGTPQTELSHLNLRLAQRGTVNLFEKDFWNNHQQYEDQLIRLEVTPTSLTLTLVEDAQEAETFWKSQQPRLSKEPEFDLSETQIKTLDEIANLEDGVAKYGAKAWNLGLLRKALPTEHVVDGFAIPHSWYAEFMGQIFNSGPFEGSTPEEVLELIQSDPHFNSDGETQTQYLKGFVKQLEDHTTINKEVVEALIQLLEANTPREKQRWRFRSSSNIEDILPFNGAGLYKSASVCREDSTDRDFNGPSWCNLDQENERTISRGLKRVWSSLWAPGAYKEREYWQVDHQKAKMGILLNLAFEEELANGVVLSGNPSVPGDHRILINVQPGEESVVNPDPGVLPERILVQVDGGVATRVDRVRPSSLSDEGEWVLSIEEARKIAELVRQAENSLAEIYDSPLGDVLFDLEFKVVEDGDGKRKILFKQVRPFLRESFIQSELTFVIPQGTKACGAFKVFSSLQEEYETLSELELIPGRLEIPIRAGTFEVEFIKQLIIGPEQMIAEALGSGQLSCELIPLGTRIRVKCEFNQSFQLDGESLAVTLNFGDLFLDFEKSSEIMVVEFDELYLNNEMEMKALFEESGRRVFWRSCNFSFLPQYFINLSTTSGDTFSLTTRHQPPFLSVGLERLMNAEVTIGNQSRETADYWDLVYTAWNHNWNRKYWIKLNPPIDETHFVEIHEPTRLPRNENPRIYLLDQNYEVIEQLEPASFKRERIQLGDPSDFTRGDVTGNYLVDLFDGTESLLNLFYGGGQFLCPDAADANDDGRIDLSDSIFIFFHAFGLNDADLPWPGTHQCGLDHTEDNLSRCDYDLEGCFER